MLSERVRLWILTRLPRGVLEDPFELFIAFLCFLSGVPLLFGKTEATSIQALLPQWLAYSWGLMLVLGSLLTVVGVLSYTHKARSERQHYARLIEKSGLGLLGGAATVYALAIVGYLGPASLIAAGVIFGFGIICLVKVFLISTAQVLITSINKAWRDEQLVEEE